MQRGNEALNKKQNPEKSGRDCFRCILKTKIILQ